MKEDIKTGLLDKNGIEILVGHIVRGCRTYDDYAHPLQDIVTVNENGQFYIGDKLLTEYQNGPETKYCSIEVVGKEDDQSPVIKWYNHLRPEVRTRIVNAGLKFYVCQAFAGGYHVCQEETQKRLIRLKKPLI